MGPREYAYPSADCDERAVRCVGPREQRAPIAVCLALHEHYLRSMKLIAGGTRSRAA